MTRDDAISRADAIKALQNVVCTSAAIKSRMVGAIEDLPSVSPSRKGHWLHKEITDDYRVTGQCSECKERKIIDNFCPNCGADMRESEVSE